MSHVVKVPLAIVRTTDGKLIHLYDGQPVPENADPDDVKRLADEGAIGAEGNGDDDNGSTDAEDDAAPSDAERPAGNSSHEAWATYAVQSGQATEDEVRNLTRDELRELYG